MRPYLKNSEHEKAREPEGMTQVVEHPPSKGNDLSSKKKNIYIYIRLKCLNNVPYRDPTCQAVLCHLDTHHTALQPWGGNKQNTTKHCGHAEAKTRDPKTLMSKSRSRSHLPGCVKHSQPQSCVLRHSSLDDVTR
jgi:hypothetical protein